MPTIGNNSAVTRIDHGKKLFGVVVSMYKKSVDGYSKPQTVYNVMWDSYLCPVPHLKSEITQNILGNYTYNETHHNVHHHSEAKPKFENEDSETAKLNDASIVREQCVKIMKKNPVFNEILIVSERGINKKNSDREIKNCQLNTNNNCQTFVNDDDQYSTASDDKENIDVVNDRFQPLWKNIPVTKHYFTQDSPVFSDKSTCSPFKYF
jgi:hypothetical protein